MNSRLKYSGFKNPLVHLLFFPINDLDPKFKSILINFHLFLLCSGIVKTSLTKCFTV